MGNQDAAPRRLVTAADAALIFGTSDKTIRRRATSGELDGYKDEAGRWLIWIDEAQIPENLRSAFDERDAHTTADRVAPVNIISADDIQPLANLIDKLIEDNRRATFQLGTVEERLRTITDERDKLAAELDALKSAPLALPAPEPDAGAMDETGHDRTPDTTPEPEPLETPDAAPTPEPEPEPEPEQEPVKRTFWQKLWNGWNE